MSPVLITDWSFETRVPPHQAPELGALRLCGRCFGHPRKEDGKRVITSEVVDIGKVTRIVRTKTGTLYRLGTVSPDYAEWAKEFAPEHMDLIKEEETDDA